MLEAVDLACERGGRSLFSGLSFALRGGELLRVAGPNGSGKTSLLRILCGLLSPTTGAVRWGGTEIRRLREEYSKQLVYIGHAAAVKDDLTAAENLRIACTLAGLRVSPRQIQQALDAFELADLPVKRLSQVSGGEPCWRGWSSAIRFPFGCSTSRMPRSTRRRVAWPRS